MQREDREIRLATTLDGKSFQLRLTVAIALGFFGTPAAGLAFLVGITNALSRDELLSLMGSSGLPYYIVGTALAAIAFFRWYLKPVAEFADESIGVDDATRRMRSFNWVFWILFTIRHLVGAGIFLEATRSVLGQSPESHDWIRMLSLALMLSSLMGLPVFLYIVDSFAATFQGNTLREPVLRVRSRVFLIAALLPALLYTAVLQFLLPRLGGLSTELVVLWLVLLLIAILMARNLMRSLDLSMSGLRRVSGQDHDVLRLRPETLRVRSMDEFGVLTCEYRELLTDLRRQTVLLNARNLVLQAASRGTDSEAVFEELLRIVAYELGSRSSMLVAVTETGALELLATAGDARTFLTPKVLSPELLKATKAAEPTVLSFTVESSPFSEACDLVVVPLQESSGTNEYLAVFACLQPGTSSVEPVQLQLLVELSPEIAAAVRAARVAKQKAALEHMLLNAQRMEVMGRLAAGIAHDFNNILSAIMGAAGIMQIEARGGGLSADAVAEHTELIVEATESAAALTQQLLTFSRPSDGRAKALNMSDAVRSLEKFLRRLLPREVKLSVSLSDVPHVRADKGHIEQVITNLVVNARDAMQEGGQILVSTKQEGEWVVLRVIDSGSGMAPEVAAHVFEPFFTTKSHDKGTGLGLATVYGILKNSGGTIEVDSAVGRGTEMVVRLPVADRALSVKSNEAEPGPDTEPTGATVLLVEDDDAVRRIIADLLASNGFRVVAVRSGESAIERINDADLKADLLLTDIVMPGIKGTEVASRMAELHSECKILLMTGYADSDTLDMALAAGRMVINKPFTPERLLAEIDQLLA